MLKGWNVSVRRQQSAVTLLLQVFKAVKTKKKHQNVKASMFNIHI